MRLNFAKNLAKLPGLSPTRKLPGTFHGRPRASAGTAMACLLAVGSLAVLPQVANARTLHVFHEDDRFKFESASVAEGDTQTIRITKKVQGIVTLHYWNEYKSVTRPCCASATIGGDVPNIAASTPGEISFQNAANVQRDITVQSNEDTTVELDEEYFLKFKELHAIDLGDGSRGRPEYFLKVKILNDDRAELTVGDEWVFEGQDLVFGIKLHAALPRSVKVTPQITYGTATAEDITATLSTLTFAGTKDETKTLTVKTVDDSIVEGLHEFTVSLAVTQETKPWSWINGSGTRNLSPFLITDGTGRISDNEMALSVPENSPGGTSVGEALGTALVTYSLSGLDGIFTIDDVTGQVSVAEGANLDYETTSTHTGTITQTLFHSEDIATTINVTDVDEPPGTPAAPQVAAQSSQALSVSWSAPSNTGPAITDYDVQYQKVGASDWTSHAFTGAGTQTTISGLDPGTSYEVQVLARNDEGASPWSESGSGTTYGPPVITNPGDKTYQQGQTITNFGITVADEAVDSLTVTVTGLPSGLSYSNDEVQGTVPSDATVQDYTVTIRAVDEENLAATATFTITVVPPNDPPVITNPGDKTYQQGEAITPFRIVVSDPDSDNVRIGATGLPTGLNSGIDLGFDPEIHSSPWLISGTVSTEAAAQAYTVTLSADDEINAAVTETFTITVTEPVPVTIEDASANEGDSITFTVALKKAVSGGLTVTPSFTDGTATEGTDYTENTAALAFAGTAGETKNLHRGHDRGLGRGAGRDLHRQPGGFRHDGDGDGDRHNCRRRRGRP